MSKTGSSVEDIRREGGSSERNALGALRRYAVKLTRKVLWKLEGVALLDGVTKEAPESEVFPGIGFHSRPKEGANAEAIVAYLGNDPESPVVVATRDQGMLKEMTGGEEFPQDATAVFNSKVIASALPTSKYEIRSKEGVANRLPTMEDYDRLVTAFNNLRERFYSHSHTLLATTSCGAGSGSAVGSTNGLATSPPTPVAEAPSGTGTTVLEAE